MNIRRAKIVCTIGPASRDPSQLRALIEAGGVFAVAGALALALATLIVPWIALRILRMWADGTLAERTNPATA